VNELWAVVVGIAVGLVAWLAIAPWDLSEVDRAGRTIAGGGDHLAPRIAAALVVVTVVYCIGVFVLDRVPIIWAAGGSCAVWVALFAWRASAARVDGANFWPVALVMVVMPAAALAFGAVAFCSLLRGRRRPVSSPPFDR
jgi:hypothetical protein